MAWLLHQDRLMTPEDIDNLICAEFPDETHEPLLFSFAKDHMVHGPCVNTIQMPRAPKMKFASSVIPNNL